MATHALDLRSPAFGHGEKIPPRYTCEGEDAVPELQWSAPPPDTQSFALIVDDPDAAGVAGAPDGPFVHWILFDLPPSSRGVGRGEEALGTPGRNDFQHEGWGGPCPPPNHGEHRYRFHLHALDVPTLDLERGASRDEVERAMEGHVLADAELVGRFERGARHR